MTQGGYTTPTEQRILELGPSGDKHAGDLTQNLSALAAENGLLWLGAAGTARGGLPGAVILPLARDTMSRQRVRLW